MLSVKDVSDLVHLSPQRIKQLLKESNWDITREGKSGIIKIPHNTVRNFLEHRNLQYNKKICTIAVEKGGVGKTFLTTNVGVIAAARGARVLVIDLDPEACATNTLLPEEISYRELKTMLEVYQHDITFDEAITPTRYTGLDLVPCKGKARRTEKIVISENPKYLISRKLESIKDRYDLILFDLPPSFTTLISSAYLACDSVVMPCMPNVYCEESIELTIADIKDEAIKHDGKIPDLYILLNAFRSTEISSRDTRHNLEIDHKDLLLPFEIKKCADVQNNINTGLSVVEGKFNREVRNDILQLVDFICPTFGTGIDDKEGLSNSSIH